MKKILTMVLAVLFILSGCAAPAAVDPEKAYADTINDFKVIVDGVLNETLDDVSIRREEFNKLGLSDGFCTQLKDKSLSNSFVQEVIRGLTENMEEATVASFGYALDDINGDSSPELFWMRDDHVLLGVFTLVNGKATAVAFHGVDGRAAITESGSIYSCVESSANYYSCEKLKPNSAELEVEFAFAHDGYNDGKKVCFEYVNGERVSIEEDRYQALREEHPFEMSERWLNLTMQPLA